MWKAENAIQRNKNLSICKKTGKKRQMNVLDIANKT